MSDNSVTSQLTDLCISCPARVNSPSAGPLRTKQNENSPITSRPASSRDHNPIRILTAPSILRGVHERVPTIPRTTSLEDFKLSTPAARRVSWADVLGQPGSLRTIVTYELSESDDEDDDSVGVTDTSTTQGTTLSDEDEDNDLREPSQAGSNNTTASSAFITPQNPLCCNNKAVSIRRSLLGRPKTTLLQQINSNSSIEISDDETEVSLPQLQTQDIMSEPNHSQRRKMTVAGRAIGRSLLGRPKVPSQLISSCESSVDQSTRTRSTQTQLPQIFNISPESLVPTRLSNSSSPSSRADTSRAADLGRTLLGRPRRSSN